MIVSLELSDAKILWISTKAQELFNKPINLSGLLCHMCVRWVTSTYQKYVPHAYCIAYIIYIYDNVDWCYDM